MFRSPFLDWLKRQRQITNNRPARVARDSRQRKLCLEPLEDRTLLNATVTDVHTDMAPNSILGSGQTVTVAVHFDQLVDVIGAPTIQLNDSAHSVGTFFTNTDGQTPTFSFVVPAGDTTNGAALDYTSATALSLSGGTINDHSDALPANLTLPTPATANDLLQSANIVIDAAPPAVTGVAPSAGPLGGGNTVVITGTDFSGTSAVNFGTTPATSFTVNSDSQITAVAPTGSAGTVDLTITSVGGTSTTSAADHYTYVAAPTVTGLSPTAGPTSGGTTVVITGTGFTGATAVNFGTHAATSFTVDSATQITAVAPAGSAGAADVTVVTAGGTSATSASDKFTYVAAPTITSIVPTSGPLGGGTTVVITGNGFTGATAVNFGTHAATSFTVDSATQITAVAPAESAGTVDVSVTTVGGTSTAGAADHYTYVAGPTVNALSPTAGPTSGGTTVVITGTGFTGATAVNFGSTTAVFHVDSATQITAVVPAGAAGVVNVTVTTVGGTSAPAQFIYVAPTPAETPAPAPSPAPTIPQQVQRLFQSLIAYQISVSTGNTAGAISAAAEFQATLAVLEQEIFQIFLKAIHHS